MVSIFVNSAALLLLAAVAAGTPISAEFDLSTATRVTRFSDVAHKFTAQYKFSADCPNNVEISNIKIDNTRNVGTVTLPDIVEDGNQCNGRNPMSLVSEDTVRELNLATLKFPLAAAGLSNNEAAKATIFNPRSKKTNMLVGFDEGVRTCGSRQYPDSSFFFFINEPEDFTISVDTASRTKITIPKNTRALFIAGTDKQLCVLSDTTTGNNGNVVVKEGLPRTESPSPEPSPKASKPPAPVPIQSKAPTPSPSTTKTTGPIATASASPDTAEPVTGESPAPNDIGNALPASTGNTTGSTDSSGAVCFPAHATVELESGASVAMTALHIGDRVRTGVSSFSDVFLFTHRDADVHAQFVRFHTASGRAVTLTKSHYIYVNNELTSAGNVRIGDELHLSDGSMSSVVTVENVSSNGLYNPQTIDGNLVVDGIITSAYTTAVHPRVAHGALLAPLRFLYERFAAAGAVLDFLTRFISSGADALARIVPSGPLSFAA